MTGLFDTLFRLRSKSEKDPLEDFTTEIFAHCLNLNKEILYDFLKSHNIIEKEFEKHSITTQYHLTKVNDQESDSRPDIAIFLDNADIFFENKIGSPEGKEQLKRYAEHLDKSDKEYKTLVYLTRDYDKKEKVDIVKDCKNKETINFTPLRWYEIAHFFENYKDINPIIQEFLIFLKAKGLSMNKQFSQNDIQTLNNFSNVTQMMDETMGGKVIEKFKSIDGNISLYSARFTQLRNHNRYIDGHSFAGKDQHWIGFGYWFKYYDEQEYPELFVTVESAPKGPKREELIDALKKITNQKKYQKNWTGYRLDDPSAWAGISCGRSLQDFLEEEDHIKAIQDFFIDAINELNEIFHAYVKPLYPKKPS